MRHNLVIFAVFLVLCSYAYTKPLDSSSSAAEDHQLNESGLDFLRRFTRNAVPVPANGNNKCKYRKGNWSACDPETKVRTRTFTLKRGDASVCESQKTIRKECKGKKEGGGKKNKQSRDRENGNQQGKNRDRPRKKNNHNNN